MNEIENMPKHIAIIMDGNRRWAKGKNMPPEYGHKKGAETLEIIAKAANKMGIKYLTVYAFSTENWKRSKEEVSALMKILKTSITNFGKKADKSDIKINVLGDIEELSADLKKAIQDTVLKTKENKGLVLNIAFNYGGRAEIIKAVKEIAKEIKDGKISVENIEEEMFSNYLYTKNMPDPDLVIRTSAEQRTSNFLPWQITYSELYFPEIAWPDFNENELKKAIVDVYQKRDRRFGGK